MLCILFLCLLSFSCHWEVSTTRADICCLLCSLPHPQGLEKRQAHSEDSDMNAEQTSRCFLCTDHTVPGAFSLWLEVLTSGHLGEFLPTLFSSFNQLRALGQDASQGKAWPTITHTLRPFYSQHTRGTGCSLGPDFCHFGIHILLI